MKVEITLDNNDINTLRDVIFSALNIEANPSDALSYWIRLPNEIKLDAAKWGVSDTEVRDKIYEWLLKNEKIHNSK